MAHRWQEYMGVRTGTTQERIHVTVNARGNIYLNRKALEALGMPEAVVLLFDPGTRTIGIRRAAAERRNSHRLATKDVRGRGRAVYAADFLSHYGIKITETLAFDMAEVDDDGILVLNLNETVAAGKRKVGV